MASRYWVGGSAGASWVAGNTTHWAATSGGASGASYPTAADDVFFDANSGIAGTSLTINNGANSVCLSLSFAGVLGLTLNLISPIYVSGNFTGSSNLSVGPNGNTLFMMLGTGKTFAPLGVTGSLGLGLGAGANITVTGANTFDNFALGAGSILTLPAGTTTTLLSGSYGLSGVTGNRITIKSSSAGTAATLTVPASAAISHATLQDITSTNAITARSSQNVSGNTNITFADRYWVGGTSTWDTTAGTKWATYSGGAGGAAVPTSTDNVYFDSSSGSSPTITLTANASCLDLNFTGAITPTLAGTTFYGISVFGHLTFILAMTNSMTGTVTFSSLTTGKTVTTNGTPFGGAIVFDGVGGGWTLQDNVNLATGFITLSNGTLNTNSKTVTSATAFNCSGTGVRSLILGASVINVSSSWTFTVTTNLTFNAGTSTINHLATSGGKTFNGGGLTYYNVNFSGTPITVAGSNTFNVITLSASCTINLTAGSTQTFNNLVSNGSAGNLAVLQSLTAGSPATLSTSSAINVSYLSVQDITRAGAGSMVVSSGINVSGNTGIVFKFAKKIMGLSASAVNKIPSPTAVNKVS